MKMSLWEKIFKKNEDLKEISKPSESNPEINTVMLSEKRNDDSYQNESKSISNLKLDVEDVRSSKDSDGEIILNLWYVTGGTFIYELRMKKYIASGTDDQKLKILQIRSKSDFNNAQVYPVPENMKSVVNISSESNENKKVQMCMLSTLDFLGGKLALFKEIILNVPNHGFHYDPQSPMICITTLVNKDGQLSPQIDGFEQL